LKSFDYKNAKAYKIVVLAQQYAQFKKIGSFKNKKDDIENEFVEKMGSEFKHYHENSAYSSIKSSDSNHVVRLLVLVKNDPDVKVIRTVGFDNCFAERTFLGAKLDLTCAKAYVLIMMIIKYKNEYMQLNLCSARLHKDKDQKDYSYLRKIEMHNIVDFIDEKTHLMKKWMIEKQKGILSFGRKDFLTIEKKLTLINGTFHTTENEDIKKYISW